MTRRLFIPIVLALAVLVGCAGRQKTTTSGTLAELRRVEPDLQEVAVDQGLDQAMEGYRRFLKETPETALTPEAMRRLADLQLEKQFGLHGGNPDPREMAAPEAAAVSTENTGGDSAAAALGQGAGRSESDADFERRTTAANEMSADDGASPPAEGPLEAIALYDRLLAEYPNYEHRDQVLYQKARAYDELGRTEEAIETMEWLIEANPHSAHYDEVQFRRGEYFFTRRQYRDAESAYSNIIAMGDGSSYYELALYKLGWTLYKQEFYEEALHRYMALLDYRISVGYDFDQTQSEDDERRVSDTFRVISLSLNSLGGPESVAEYFTTFGNRSYEDRVYNNLGAHYLDKLRYDDAAKTYRSFVELYPLHRTAPHFSMRVVDTFTQGGFPRLVLEAKREFASKYSLQADYWRHFAPDESPEVLAYLKANLKDLANHYHAEYQAVEDEAGKRASYQEALRWYGDSIASFPEDPDTPPIHYQLADLHLEHESFGEAAAHYERTAYEYEPHDQSAAAGYAAVYAYRRQLEGVDEARRDVVRQSTVISSLKFADTFPDHEHAAAVLGAAADDLYEMSDYVNAIETARRVLESYPDAELPVRRSAWLVTAHGSLEVADYPSAEVAYNRVLVLTPEGDERDALIDNLAASIYKQGELANEAEDYRAAADHFLRIRSVAPTSSIRATAEYDAGAALLKLANWTEAAGVFEAFRSTYPDHELNLEATRQIAFAYKQDGQLQQAANEFNRLATEAEDPAIRSEALLVAGDLYEQTELARSALDVYARYVEEFPRPVEMALEIRFKIAEIHQDADDEPLYHQELTQIVRIEADAGSERTGRTRTIAARSALVLAERQFDAFTAVELLQPFETSLQEKQQRMDTTINSMRALVEYEIADVTAAATFYMAETYLDFSRSLADSERPADLQPQDLMDYEMALEEEAFPFEERAIDVHEKNLELLQAGVFNEWTERSLGQLAELVPGRYAKNEMSSDFLGSLDVYVYRSPASAVYGPTLERADAATAIDAIHAINSSVPTPLSDDDEVRYVEPQ